ncbi:MAG TPA: Hpt domain-containing protein, partial [Geobacteraceae bacterium]
MDTNDQEFLKRLLATFKVEAEEHLKEITSGLIELEKFGGAEVEAELVENIFREAHSLKGAARAVNLGEIETLCQAMESVFAAFKRKEAKPSSGLFDVLQGTVDLLGRIIPTVDTGRTPEEKALLKEFVKRLETAGRDGERARGIKDEEERGAEREAGEGPMPEGELKAITEAQTTSLGPRISAPAMAETVRVSTAKL